MGGGTGAEEFDVNPMPVVSGGGARGVPAPVTVAGNQGKSAPQTANPIRSGLLAGGNSIYFPLFLVITNSD